MAQQPLHCAKWHVLWQPCLTLAGLWPVILQEELQTWSEGAMPLPELPQPCPSRCWKGCDLPGGYWARAAVLLCGLLGLFSSLLWFLDVSLLSLWPGTGRVYKALGQQLAYHGACSYLNIWRHCWDCKISMGKAGRRLHRDPRQSFLIYHYYCLPELGCLCSSPELWFVTSRGKKK